MAGSPRRIYRNYSDAQLLRLKDALFQRELEGSFTSLSGQNHSSQREYSNAEDQLFELNYELGARGLGAANPPTVVYQDFTGLKQQPNTLPL